MARPDGDGVESLSLNAAAQAAAVGLTVTYTDSTGVPVDQRRRGDCEATLQAILEGIEYTTVAIIRRPLARTVTVTVADAAANASLVHRARRSALHPRTTIRRSRAIYDALTKAPSVVITTADLTGIRSHNTAAH